MNKAMDLKTATMLEKKMLEKYGKTSTQLGFVFRDQNNATIEWFDGDFSYGTSEGEHYCGGEYKTHEAFVCAFPKMVKFRSEIVVDKLERNWGVSAADMPKLLAKRIYTGKCIL